MQEEKQEGTPEEATPETPDQPDAPAEGGEEKTDEE